jgi:hypothetical protein
VNSGIVKYSEIADWRRRARAQSTMPEYSSIMQSSLIQ